MSTHITTEMTSSEADGPDVDPTSSGPRLGAWLFVVVVAAIGLTLLDSSPSAGTYHEPGEEGGYWMVGEDGTITGFGDAGDFGDVPTVLGGPSPTPIVAMASMPSGNGYIVLDRAGAMFFFGDAPNLGNAGGQLAPGEIAAAISITPTGNGYWIFSDRGRVFAFGDAPNEGDLAHLTLDGPVVSSVATPSGEGYYMLGSDGGVFAFGDAAFWGSVPQILPGVQLDCPVVGLVPTPTGLGYWLVACDGGVFSFGDAGFVGSIPSILPGVQLDQPINGMVPYGNGYLMVAFDGGVFNFATDLDFLGSLGGQVLPAPIIGVVPLPS